MLSAFVTDRIRGDFALFLIIAKVLGHSDIKPKVTKE